MLACGHASSLSAELPSAEDEDEDSDAHEDEAPQAEVRRSSNSAPSTSGQLQELAAAQAAPTTRLRTRRFAATCLLELPDLVASDTRHRDPLAAQVSIYITHSELLHFTTMAVQALLSCGDCLLNSTPRPMCPVSPRKSQRRLRGTPQHLDIVN